MQSGIYEELISEGMNQQLSELPEECKSIENLDTAEASRALSQYTAKIIQEGLNNVADQGGDLSRQIALTNQIIRLIQSSTGESVYEAKQVHEPGEQLLALLDEHDPNRAIGKQAKDISRPLTSISNSSLFTNSQGEYPLFTELSKEMESADSIDMLVSFIKWSGLIKILSSLKTFTDRGGKLRVITTSYMGATDLKAVEELSLLQNTEIKVSYDTARTRLHAKAYLFTRNNGYSTAYIGSSNLSNPAITEGTEWNMKVTQRDQPDIIAKVRATFDGYWNTAEYETYTPADRERLAKALNPEDPGDGPNRYLYDLNPFSYQQEILDQLRAEREVRHHYKNLVVAATGTGKTMIAAFDYRNFCQANLGKSTRLLFIAHREEILKQSQDAFRMVLKDPNFGELFTGKTDPKSLDHVFLSIFTAESRDLTTKIPADYYDFIIIDEFHHAAAPVYQKVLQHFKPKILLGLTATPERMDGKNILNEFDGRIAAEIRLPEAIDRKLLCPFQYFGVADTVDLTELKWTRGGYDKSELSNLYTFSQQVAERRANHIVNSLQRYVTDIHKVHGIGFCVSVEHARFMADFFNTHDIPSIYLTGDSTDAERFTARDRLTKGEIRFIFVVDLYNEGVDIPAIDTILFLRPTESLTIFLQQLGRGLRLYPKKECLMVLDFVGLANRKYNFEEKFNALLTNTRHGLRNEINHGFVSVPKGCFIQLEKKAEQAILDNIRQAFSTKKGLLDRIENFTDDTELPLNLKNFLDYYHLGLSAIYAKFSFSRLCVEADRRDDFQEPVEAVLTRAFSRIAAIDSRRWIEFLLDILPRLDDVDFAALNETNSRLLQMFYITVWGKAAMDWNSDEVLDNLYNLADSPVMLAELIELLQYKYDSIDFVDKPVDLGFICPLDLHCSYTRDQLLVALDYMTPNNVREGVKWLPEKGTDVFMVTLNKSDKDYSPTTMYEDYSINEELFHWQSQSTTSENSSTGQRYIHHKEMGTQVLLFVREFKQDAFGAAPYTFLGPVSYVSHNGSRPMNIIWKLDEPIPAKFLKVTNKMIVG